MEQKSPLNAGFFYWGIRINAMSSNCTASLEMLEKSCHLTQATADFYFVGVTFAPRRLLKNASPAKVSRRGIGARSGGIEFDAPERRSECLSKKIKR